MSSTPPRRNPRITKLRDLDAEPRDNCIVIELTNGTHRAYAFVSADTAAEWHAACRDDWNNGRSLIFYVRHHGRVIDDILPGDEVAHIELTRHDKAAERGIQCFSALKYGT